VARRARDIVEQLLSSRRDEVRAHIVARLRELCRERGEFNAVHVCPASPAEVPDNAECRLVVLAPGAPHVNRDAASQAMGAARGLLEARSSGARQYRNMVVFLAPDHRRLEELEWGAAEHLAWSEIHDHWEELGLDAFGRNQAESKRREADQAVEARAAETTSGHSSPTSPTRPGPSSGRRSSPTAKAAWRCGPAASSSAPDRS